RRNLLIPLMFHVRVYIQNVKLNQLAKIFYYQIREECKRKSFAMASVEQLISNVDMALILLPDEVIEYVLSFLSVSALYHLSCTCSRFHSLIIHKLKQVRLQTLIAEEFNAIGKICEKQTKLRYMCFFHVQLKTCA